MNDESDLEPRDPPKERRPWSFPRVELLLGVAAVILVMGLLLWQIHRLRQAANVAQSLNNLKEMSFACQRCNDLYKCLPPGVGQFPRPDSAPGTVFSFVNPFMREAPQNGATPVVPGFLAPADPTLPPLGLVRNHAGIALGATSYAANGYVFAGDGNITQLRPPPDVPPACENLAAAVIPRTFNDGTANTILFMEKYAGVQLVLGWDFRGSRGRLESGWKSTLILHKGVEPCLHVRFLL
jgi:hypothetical protein